MAGICKTTVLIGSVHVGTSATYHILGSLERRAYCQNKQQYG